MEHAQAFDVARRAQHAQPAQLEQRDRGRRELAEAVEHLQHQVVEPREVAGLGEPAVEIELLVLVGDVVVRQVRAPVGQEPRLGLDLARLALQRRHRLLQQLHVQIEPQAHDEPALLGPQQVAGAADLQVLERDLEPHTQVVELLDHPQPLLGVLGQHAPRRHQQIREGAV